MKIRNVNSTIDKLFIGLLLCVYVFQFLSIYTEVEFSHTHETGCESAVESNLCHQSIYHHGKINACKHAVHITKTIKVCEKCQQLASTYNQTSLEPTNLHLAFYKKQSELIFSQIRLAENQSFQRLISNRGPPILVV